MGQSSSSSSSSLHVGVKNFEMLCPSLFLCNSDSMGKANPLLIHLIVENVFKYCDFEGLAQARRVCKLWYQLSFPKWLETAPTTHLTLDKDLSEGGIRNMADFLAVAHNDFRTYSSPYDCFGLRQYKKFHIDANLAAAGLVGQEQQKQHQQLLLFQLFFRSCGEWITELKLSVTLPNLEAYERLVLSNSTPNLVSLDMYILFPSARVKFDSYEPRESSVQQLPCLNNLTTLTMGQGLLTYHLDVLPLGDVLLVDGWIQLLRRSPNLQALRIGSSMDTSSKTSLGRMLEAIRKIREEDRKSLNLKHLEMHFDEKAPRSLLRLFREPPSLALETLNISVGEATPTDQMYGIFASQASTLKELTFGGGSQFQKSLPPVMGSVEKLELGKYQFHRLSFLKSFPNLKSLGCAACDKSKSDIALLFPVFAGIKDDELGGLVLSTLTTFHCDYEKEEGVFGLEDIHKLARVMPNLTDLHLWLTNNSFRAVCKCWPSLKKLCIIGDEVDDQGITGFVSSGLKQRRRGLHPNITDLKDLESVTMYHYISASGSDRGPLAITERSVFDGFLHLPKLTNLTITLNSKMNKAARKFIKNRIPNVRIVKARGGK